MLDFRDRSRLPLRSCRALAGTTLLALMVSLLASCSGTTVESAGEFQYLSLDRSEVFAAPRRSIRQEIRDIESTLRMERERPGALSQDARNACVIRLAYLQARQGDFASAESGIDSLFRHNPAPRTQALVLAHLLRADLAERKSDKPKALAELAAAERLSRDPRDRNEIDRRRHRIAMQPGPATVETPKPAKTQPSAWTASKGKIVLLERKKWGSRKEVRSRLNKMTKIHRLTVHHTAMVASDTRAGNASQLRSIQRRHIMVNGWGDLGYHFMIGRDGTVFEGRRLRYQGAHAGDPASNRGNIGICLLGDFSRGVQVPTTIQLRSLQKLTVALCSRYRIAPSGILTHKEVRPGHGTDCPGAYMTAVVQNMRNAYRIQLAKRSD